ncbi:AraC family transcriptional regulator [Paenibacillus sp. FSL H8-0548]|uniref:AraC family transcriptional regulator n=1 Tax=Paenibacillus sp. FSL H8-0548 TaxID=1920422 RepID=UPI00096CD87D|nr:AraC family transcriptional regulator [Paenibacillus sp. FSL H8-0548]OMF37740.1 AraC family transcriptional regulator [Paenibacillus sp. FSL H8-0548]
MEEQNRKRAFPPPITLFILQSIQFVPYTPNAKLALEKASSYTLLIFTKGRAAVRTLDEELVLEQGKCLLLRPEMTLAMESDGCSYYLLEFNLSAEEEHTHSHSLLPEKLDLVCAPFAKVLELLEDIYRNSHEADELQLYYCYVRFQELLLLLFSQNTNAAVEKRGSDSSEQHGVERSIRHIHQHYCEVLTVEELAAIANIERWKYTRLFKEATGQVPLQYLNSARIAQAKKYLMSGEEKLSDIAQHAGFTNEYYFNRRFKQSVGITPGQYRRSHRDQPRVVAPYLEDFLVALDIMPVVQYSHAKWGKQEYLALNHIPTFDEQAGDFKTLSTYSPDFIVLLDRYHDNEYSQCRNISSTYIVRELSENWRTLLRIVGDYFGRSERAEAVIADYEAKANTARQTLNRCMNGETVAFLRISADHVHQYTTGSRGFAAAVLYGDLGLNGHLASGNAADHASMIEITLEDLSAMTADHLFITFDKWHSQVDGAERGLLKHPIWSTLPAVRRNHVYEVDFLTWMNHGVISNTKKIDDILQVLA